MYFDYKEMVPARATYNYYDQNMKVYFSKVALFDTLYLETEYNQDGSRHDNVNRITRRMWMQWQFNFNAKKTQLQAIFLDQLLKTKKDIYGLGLQKE